MPKVSEAHREARRDQILEAALECFARQGFHQTTMDDICRAADLSAGAVYGYFQSKEEIIEASCEGCEQAASAALGADAGPLAALDQLAEGAFGGLNEPGAHRFLSLQVQWWSEAIRNPRLRASLQRTTVSPWTDGLSAIIGEAQCRGEVDRSIEAQAAGRVLLAIWQGLLLQKALEPGVDVQRCFEVVKAMYSGSFRAGGNDGVRRPPHRPGEGAGGDDTNGDISRSV